MWRAWEVPSVVPVTSSANVTDVMSCHLSPCYINVFNIVVFKTFSLALKLSNSKTNCIAQILQFCQHVKSCLNQTYVIYICDCNLQIQHQREICIIYNKVHCFFILLLKINGWEVYTPGIHQAFQVCALKRNQFIIQNWC